MPLYATGFNPWGQLQFRVSSSDSELDEPDDLSSFTCVLADEGIRRVRASLSYTQVDLENGETRIAGMVPRNHQVLRAADQQTYATFAEASNGTVVIHDGQDALRQYPSISDLISNATPSSIFPNYPATTQIVAYATGFAALDPSTGRVWTWGDERYSACLGRDVNHESPATAPHLLTDLLDLPTGLITKLAASPSGYILAALTAGGDLYCWGDAARSGAALHSSLHLSYNDGAPVPVVISPAEHDDNNNNDNNNDTGIEKDVVDVAVGDAHLVALTADGEVYVLGDNSSGQLGLPGRAAAREWMRVELDGVLESGKKVTSVVAGPRSSLLVVERRIQDVSE
ncbi:hypothetical protein VTJ49DRAFT_6721 [Mycothermus thermophilus]|uniref:Uncharacterized protein n=1 Tax=Humicola insolens TaxID=85995 RepID=A0ABR3VJB6_HUMIN